MYSILRDSLFFMYAINGTLFCKIVQQYMGLTVPTALQVQGISAKTHSNFP